MVWLAVIVCTILTHICQNLHPIVRVDPHIFSCFSLNEIPRKNKTILVYPNAREPSKCTAVLYGSIFGGQPIEAYW